MSDCPSNSMGKIIFLGISVLHVLIGKDFWGHIDGTTVKPTEITDTVKSVQWVKNDAKVISWILSLVDPQIVLNLRPHKTTKKTREYLKKIYNQDNSTRRFQLESEISEYCQGTKSIQEYYSGFINLWTEFEDLVYATVSDDGLTTLQQYHEVTERDQFLIKVRDVFETIAAGLLGLQPIPSLVECLGELLREKQRCLAKTAMGQNGSASSPLDVAYATQVQPRSASSSFDVTFATQPKRRDKSKSQCYSCKEFGHIASQCKKKTCNYCKKPGHIISEYRRWPQNRQPLFFTLQRKLLLALLSLSCLLSLLNLPIQHFLLPEKWFNK